jgi:hypothetical protein
MRHFQLVVLQWAQLQVSSRFRIRAHSHYPSVAFVSRCHGHPHAGCHHTLTDGLNRDHEMSDLPGRYDDARVPRPSIAITKSGEFKIIMTGCFI